MVLRGMEFREEVHAEGVGELGRSAEGYVDVAMEDLGDVRARDVHALRDRSLGEPLLLHEHDHLPEKGGTDSVNCVHGAGCGVRGDAPRPWGMQPNTSLEDAGSTQLAPSCNLYYTINRCDVRSEGAGTKRFTQRIKML